MAVWVKILGFIVGAILFVAGLLGIIDANTVENPFSYDIESWESEAPEELIPEETDDYGYFADDYDPFDEDNAFYFYEDEDTADTDPYEDGNAFFYYEEEDTEDGNASYSYEDGGAGIDSIGSIFDGYGLDAIFDEYFAEDSEE